jgi:hypothetical protein
MDWAWTTNEYDERPASDIIDVVICMESYVTRRGGYLGLSLRRIRDQIIGYVRWRMRHAWMDVSPPRHEQVIPLGWTSYTERLWTDWLADTFHYDDWEREVIDPVFGTDERFWETRCSTQWRREVFGFLPFWIERDWDIVDDYDPNDTEEYASDTDGATYDADEQRRRR